MTKKLLDSTQLSLLRRFAANQLNELELEQVRSLLKRFINGELDYLEAEQVMIILGDNEHCLDLLEELWLEQPLGRALAQTEILDVETSRRIEQTLVRRIHRTTAVTAVANLGIRGFASVASSLLKPLARRNNWPKSRRGVKRRGIRK